MIVPATRAQKFQWFLERGLAEGLWPLRDRSVETARAIVTTLERRFEVLRTVFKEFDGMLQQHLHDTGSPMIVIDLASASELDFRMAELVEEFRLTRQRRQGDFLIQWFLLRTTGKGWLAFVADNVAVDAGVHLVLNQEVARIMGQQVDEVLILDEADGIQPSASAALEGGERGVQERTKAANQLRRHFAVTPGRMHPRRPPSTVDEGRYYRRQLQIQNADRLFARLIEVENTLPSVLVLSVFTQLMCWRVDHEACTINVSVANRHNRQLRLTLCATAQRIPVALTGVRQPLRVYAQSVQRALSDGHPVYGRYDPSDLMAERAAAQDRRDECLSADLAFNFVPPPKGWASLVEPVDDLGGAPLIESHMSGSLTVEASYEYAASLSVRWANSQTARLEIHGDAEALLPSESEAVLFGIERVLVQLMSGERSDLSEVARQFGLTVMDPIDRAMRVAGRWIDPRPIERLLRERHDVASVVVESSGGTEPYIVARICPESGKAPSSDDLRHHLLPALESGELLILPRFYEIVNRSEPSGS